MYGFGLKYKANLSASFIENTMFGGKYNVWVWYAD